MSAAIDDLATATPVSVRMTKIIAAVLGKIPLAEIDKVNGLTERVQRMKQRYLAARPTICGQRARYWTESYRATEGEHPAKRRAKAFANALAKKDILIRDDEVLVGAPTKYLRGANPSVEQLPIHLAALLDRVEVTTGSEVTVTQFAAEDRQYLREAADYWKDKYPAKRSFETENALDGGKMHLMGEARNALRPPLTPQLFTPGADMDKILAIGFRGHIKQAREHIDAIRTRSRASGTYLSQEDSEKIEWLEAVIVSLEGMIHHAHRYAALARSAAKMEEDPRRQKELLEIADVCEWVPENPPRSFHEALQTYWFVAFGQEIEKATTNAFVGRFDQYMWPFYSRDINEGRITRQEAGELLGCMFMKWLEFEPFMFLGQVGKRDHQEISPSNYYANVTIGGTTRDGKDASNELSCLFLQVAKQVKTHQPHVSLRYHRLMAPELLTKGIECNRDHGGGIPAWFSDRLGTEYLMDRGVRWDDARDWAMAGCINTSYPKSFAWVRNAVVSFCNHSKLLEWALFNGMDTWTNKKLGIETGDPRTFTRWEQMLEAYEKQRDAFYDYTINNFRAYEKSYYEDAFYFPYISAFLQDCIADGKDVTRFGGRYQQLEAFSFVDRGFQDASDSLMAIKKVIFEDRKWTMADLLDALKNNWGGYEELRQACIAAPKYGNDEDEPDALMCKLYKDASDRCQSYRDGYGRRFTMFRQGAAWSSWAGKTTGALPNGRKAGTHLGDASASPVQGCDVKGPTAAMNSVCKLDSTFIEGPLLNMKFSPAALRTRGGQQKFASLLDTYFEKGGFQVQFNLLDTETLKLAQVQPESHRDLVVRVAGYSAFWVELSPVVQDEIISRTEQCM